MARRRTRSVPDIAGLPARSRHPFPEALKELQLASGWRWRDFADQVNAYARGEHGWTFGYLNQITLGTKRIDPGETMWAICEATADAVGIEPTYFKEYREHLAAQRAATLATRIGLDEVLAVLDDLEARRR